MYILGIHASFTALTHDPSACLMKDGKVLGALEEERLNRIKTSVGYFPYRAIEKLLKSNNLDIKKIGLVVTTGVNHKDMKEKVRSAFIHAYGYCPQIKLVHHAFAHIAGAYFSSGYKDSLILSIDGMGDKLATMVARGKNGKIKIIYKGDKTKGQLESLGAFYAMFTEFLGFKKTEGEYKLMGMAAYGKKTYNLDHIIKVSETPFKISLNKNLFVPWNVSSNFQPEVNYKFLNKFFFPKKSEKENFKQHHFNLAKSVQLKYEEILIKIIKKFKKKHTNLCFAGGCGLNCLANSKLDKIFQKLYIMPASSDRGLSIGCAYLGFYDLKKRVHKINDMFLGLKYSKDRIEKMLKLSKINFKKCNSVQKAAEDLISGKIVGWFKGRSEFGPRSLGARSILARANLSGMKKKINSRIKFREKFRPFAPVMLYDFAKKHGILKEYPFMTIARFPNKKLAMKLKETVHYDGSTRIQTVREKKHPLYNLLKRLEKRGYDPVLINTSFNISGEPIVESPRDAVRTYMSSGIDTLYIEDYKVIK